MKQAKLLFFVGIAAIALNVLSGCKKEPLLTVSTSEITVKPEGESSTFNITSNVQWFISGVPTTWLAVTPSSGEGNALVTVSAQTNTSTERRECTLSIRNIDGAVSKDVHIVQEGTPARISTNLGEVEIGASEDAAGADITITANTAWTISYPDTDWFNLSAKKGEKGTTVISVVPSKENFSDSKRSVDVVISADDGSATCSFKVVQRPVFASNLRVELKDVVTMSDGIAGGIEFGSDAKGYYELYVTVRTVSTYTDKEIYNAVINADNRWSITEDFFFSPELDPNTEYVYCVVAYNADAYTGPLMKYTFRTKPTTSTFDARLTSSYSGGWYITSTRANRCARYYQYYLTNGDADRMYSYLTNEYISNALVVYLWINEWVKEDPNYYYIIDTTKYLGTSDSICVINWGVSDTGEFSNELTYIYRTKSSTPLASNKERVKINRNIKRATNLQQ